MPGLREFEISTLINLALDCIALNRLDEAQSYLIESQRDVGRPEFGSHNWRWQMRLADAQARLALAQSKNDEADRVISKLFEQAELTRARKYLARGLVLCAERHLQRHDLSSAECDLIAATEHADQMCYFPTRIETRSKLQQLHKQIGSAAQVDRVRLELSELITELDRALLHPELRQSFERGVGARHR